MHQIDGDLTLYDRTFMCLNERLVAAFKEHPDWGLAKAYHLAKEKNLTTWDK